MPGTLSIIKFTINGLDNNGLLPYEFINGWVFPVYSRQCISGEELREDGSCVQCKIGTYLIEAPKEVAYCKKCPQNSLCPGENIIIPHKGYSRLSKFSEVMSPCYVKSLCLGGNITNILGRCKDGHSGFKCGTCEPSFSKNGWYIC